MAGGRTDRWTFALEQIRPLQKQHSIHPEKDRLYLLARPASPWMMEAADAETRQDSHGEAINAAACFAEKTWSSC